MRRFTACRFVAIMTRMGGRRICVILNPNASKGRGARSRVRIQEAFRSHGADVRILVTEKAGQAEMLALQACGEGYEKETHRG